MRRTPTFYFRQHAPTQGEVRFSRTAVNISATKILRSSGNQFRGLLRFLIKKPCLLGRVYVEYSLGRIRQKNGMRYLLTTIGFAFLFAAPIFAAEESLLARITVYWPGEGQLRACSNGARLRAGHCAVDPKRIPYGSRVLFPDAAWMAAGSSGDAVSSMEAGGRSSDEWQRSAVVRDR